ncbi:ATP-binding cassette, subfamily B [Hathewaya proteolytica DSM 3090]|uniref:ATP-binding cassette, subfamily B n=1 Tax=Hathewaya proteolytica DSM 3090 TaxID=1121331 RepID=A0A1M6R9N0_9CLOT|nr:ABC transporter ATP-binding protein [Hathewaya proteolytica]SHK29130.1 ATP-binding cassette, subfamily B [Hathewaya proteolytica DSM 3090]
MKRLLKYTLKQGWFVLIPVLSLFVDMGLDIILPLISKELVDTVLKGAQYNLLWNVLITLMVVTIIRAIMGYVEEYSFDVLGNRVHKDLKEEMFNHITTLHFGYFDNMNTGELMSRITGDVESVWRTIGFGLRICVGDFIYFIMATVVLMNISPKLTIACVAVMIPIGFLAVSLEKKEDEIYGDISDQRAEMNTAAEENIAGVRLVKAFAREKHEILKFLGMNRRNYELNMKEAKVRSNHLPLGEFLANTAIVIMICFGGYLVIKGEMTLGGLVAFNGYIGTMIWVMKDMGFITSMLAQNKASCKKIYTILDTKPRIVSPTNPVIDDIKGHVEFKNVTFKHGDSEILKNINFKAKAGDTVAIMGTTGAGKTSIVNLIGRYYDVKSGQVLVDGVDVKQRELHNLRRNMAVVPQDVFLFSDSIKNNVSLGTEDMSKEEIENACKLACADDFIQELNEKYHTVVGERGIGLSGGQKQRISIARALARKAPILILDDSTSALDMETEYQLLKNLRNKENKATTFIIAHRISAVKNADLILFMEDGEVKEQGTHKELVEKKGKYYEIYKEQFKDFLEDEQIDNKCDEDKILANAEVS